MPSPNLEFSWLNVARLDLAPLPGEAVTDISHHLLLSALNVLCKAASLSSLDMFWGSLDWHLVEMMEIPQVLAREPAGKVPFLASEWVVNLESGSIA